MKNLVPIILIILALLPGCGKAETISTDTAVTETMSPEGEATAADTAASSESAPVSDETKEADSTGSPR